MMSALVRFSIRFSGVIIGIASLIVIYGIYSLTRSNLDVFPEFSPTQLIIQTEAPGLSTDLVESLVSQPIEHSISGTVGIELMRSQSIPGLSVVTVIFKEGTDVYRNRQVVAERLATLANRMPNGITPNITPLTSAASTVMGIGITSDTKSLMELRSMVDWTLRPQLMAVQGVDDAYGTLEQIRGITTGLGRQLDGVATGIGNVSRNSGINFILDKDIRQDTRVTVFLKSAKVEEAIDLIVNT